MDTKGIRIVVVFGILFFSGCATTTQKEQLPSMTKRFLSTSQIYHGMTKKEVESVLGRKIIVGYELVDVGKEQYQPITKKNPYRSEIVRKDSSRYVIDYYIIGIKRQDGEITDDELIPLVFQYDSLIGKGWDFLNNEIKK